MSLLIDVWKWLNNLNWSLIISASIAIVGYAIQAWLSQRREHETMRRKRKEERYNNMIKALQGFYLQSEKRELKQKFIEEWNLSWLYASDDVINSTIDFFNMIKVDAGEVS